MIQLATDPNASRLNWRPAAAEAKDSQQAARRQPFHQGRGEPPAAATGIDRALVASYLQPRQHLLAPGGLRSGHLVIRRRIPFGHAV